MTSEVRRLEEQLRTAFEGAAWHGPGVLELLAGVTPEQALARPIAGAHTIGELVLHLEGAYRLVDAEVRSALTAFPTARLAEPLVPDSPYTANPHFIGLTQHDLYRAGQIGLLKRALAYRDSGA